MRRSPRLVCCVSCWQKPVLRRGLLGVQEAVERQHSSPPGPNDSRPSTEPPACMCGLVAVAVVVASSKSPAQGIRPICAIP